MAQTAWTGGPVYGAMPTQSMVAPSGYAPRGAPMPRGPGGPGAPVGPCSSGFQAQHRPTTASGALCGANGGSMQVPCRQPAPGSGKWAAGGAGTPSLPPAALAKQDTQDHQERTRLHEIFSKIDRNGNGKATKLELISACAKHTEVIEMLLPGVDGETLLSDETSFDELNNIFEVLSKGRHVFGFDDLEKHVLRAKAAKTPKTNKMRAMFDLIDVDGNGWVSKLELVAAIQSNPVVDEFMMPGIDSSVVMEDEAMFERVEFLFEAISGGKQRFTYPDFERFFRKAAAAADMKTTGTLNRKAVRVFIFGCGFGTKLTPWQGQMIERAGFQVYWCHGPPNPEQHGFVIDQHIGQIVTELESFRPHVVVAASKGGCYVIRLWQLGLWRGPTLLLNAHPSCRSLPEGMPIVIAHGSNDEVYPTSRGELEALLASGSPNLCFLYYTANSGQLAGGQLSRIGDSHIMDSLMSHDVLPRLIDATLCSEGPEVYWLRSWRERLTEQRVKSEIWLGYSPSQIRRLWCRHSQSGGSLIEVAPNCEEFRQVCQVFKAMPKETPAYVLGPPERWEMVRPLRIERVENSLQFEGSTKPYYDSLCRSLEDQGIEFEPGTHTVWGFHGCDNSAIESIVFNPVSGFQPLASGTRSATLWGSGTYFARDAKYVAEGGFCPPAHDGTRRMIMCLLVVGMPCLGDPNHKGVLPFRRKPHRYNCSVDCIASPEIFIIQHPGAACPAYVITFA